MAFIPKPFAFEGFLNPIQSMVYLPGTHCHIVDGEHLCVCVHMCDNFFTYPTTKWGIRVIPSKAKCPFGGRCHGSRLLVNGKPSKQNIDLDSIMIENLTMPEKTR